MRAAGHRVILPSASLCTYIPQGTVTPMSPHWTMGLYEDCNHFIFSFIDLFFSSAGVKPKAPSPLGKNPTTGLQPGASIRKGLGAT